MRSRRLLITLTCIFAIRASVATSNEYGRYAIDSVTIPDGGENTQDLLVGGQNLLITDAEGNEFVGSYALAPFRFSARDFSLQQVDAINSAKLRLTNELSALSDTGNVEVFYVPDSRTDLGVNLLEETADCGWNAPARCYTAVYDGAEANGIGPADFTSAPQSLGTFEMDFAAAERIQTIFELELNDEAKTGLIDKINAGEEFHLAFGAVDADGFLEIGSFNSGSNDGPGADIRPRLIFDATGVSGGITKDLIRQGAIHFDGDNTAADFYGSGNDDNFSEYGIAGWQFSRDDFGAAAEITAIESVELTLHHNDRGFTDGDSVEFFFTSDTAESLAYDEELGYTSLTYDESNENGIADEQFNNAPISLGTYDFQGKFGGVPETFTLQLPEEAEEQLLTAINNEDDFHIIIGAPDPTFDITFSGLNNAFDPGNPQLTISVPDAVEPTCEVPTAGILGDLDGNGTVAFPDFLVLSSNFNQGVATYQEGDIDCNGTVAFPDFLVLSNNFNKSAGQTAAVPEPNGRLLCLMAFVGLSVKRIRRRDLGYANREDPGVRRFARSR